MAKRQLVEQAYKKGEQDDIPRREQGAFLREVRLRQALKQAKAPVQAPQPVPEEKEDIMEEDVEGSEKEEELEREQGEAGPNTGKASSSGQPMEVDDERKGAVAEAVTVDATKSRRRKKRKKSHRGLTWEEKKLWELSEAEEWKVRGAEPLL